MRCLFPSNHWKLFTALIRTTSWTPTFSLRPSERPSHELRSGLPPGKLPNNRLTHTSIAACGIGVTRGRTSPDHRAEPHALAQPQAWPHVTRHGEPLAHLARF